MFLGFLRVFLGRLGLLGCLEILGLRGFRVPVRIRRPRNASFRAFRVLKGVRRLGFQGLRF